MAEISQCVYGSYHIPDMLRLQDQVPLISFVSLMMMAMKYFPRMCTPPQTLSTLTKQSLLQRVLPSSLTGHTTFLQTQVCVCVFVWSRHVCICVCTCVHVCVHVNGQTGRQACVHTCVHACVYTNLPGCLYHYAYMYCTYRCCCCCSILPNWVSCRHPS